MKPAILLAAAISALHAESGSLTIHMILHAIGEERYEIVSGADGISLTTTFQYSDRGNTRTTNAALRMTADYTPLSLKIKERTLSVEVQNSAATVQEDATARTFAAPPRYFVDLRPIAVRSADGDDAVLERSR